MDTAVIPYELPEQENHSFFFIDQRIEPELEAKLHRHDAWELYCVVRGCGVRTAGDTSMTFAEGDVALIPPGMHHNWNYDANSADSQGYIRYLMVAFSHQFIQNCISIFPELRNAFTGIAFSEEALEFGQETVRIVRRTLKNMIDLDDVGRLTEFIRLLPVVFKATDVAFAGRPIRIDRDVRRMQQVSEYVMAHYVHPIRLDDIASEVGMNRSAFCSWFKRCKGMTFSHFVTDYRLNTACGLLEHSQKSVSEICYLVGFNDVPHFVRTFTKSKGVSPGKWTALLKVLRNCSCNRKNAAW